MKRYIAQAGYSLGVCFLMLTSFMISRPYPAWAACSEEVTVGTVTLPVEITESGTYRVWSRISPNQAGTGTYQLSIGGTCFQVGGQSVAATGWQWVAYQDNNPENYIDIELPAGTHNLIASTANSGLLLDRILFVSDPSCTPIDKGDSCFEVSALAGDVNGDNAVNVFDLSVILANWSQAGMTRGQGDLNRDGVVNVFDLSMLLINWGTTR